MLKVFRLSIIAFCCSIFYACDHEVIAEYSFVNKLEKEVEVRFYFQEIVFDMRVDSIFSVKSNESVLLLRNKFKSSEEGFPPQGGSSYFIDLIDSAKVKYIDEEGYIAIWRGFSDYEYASGYESLRDFYSDGGDAWSGVGNRIQHGGSHAEYRYILELRDK
ncbi:hypothetical protein CDL62_17080 [Alkalitalea saponilacus]|nr:hypothetical protein CDL62_17080 [Alkalitalea saponilacus]